MADYFRERTRLWAVAGVMVGAMLTAWDLVVAAPSFLTEYAVRNDFRLADSAAMVGLHDGYARLYDLSAHARAIRALGPEFNVQPLISPPPPAWLVTPLTALPFVRSLVIWTALLLPALLGSWYLLAPGGAPARAALLGLLSAPLPVALGVSVCTPAPLHTAPLPTPSWLLTPQHP